MEGWITDAYTDLKRNRVILWVKGEKVRKFEFAYRPRFYINGNTASLNEMARRLSAIEGVRNRMVRRKAAPRMQQSEMLEVSTDNFRTHRRLAEEAYSFGGHTDCMVYDADTPIEQRFMLENDVFPLAFVSIEGSDVKCLDSINELYYEMPRFNIATLSVSLAESPPSTSTAISSITINGEKVEDEEEKMLFELPRILDAGRCDIILTSGGDAFEIRHLYNRAEYLGVDGFTLGRDAGFRGPYAAKSYMSYGRIYYKPSPVLLNGRLHIDTENAFLHAESGMEGLMEISRLSYMCPQQLSRLSPGTAISSMETIEAMRQNAVVPWKKNRPEMFKTAGELVESDRGGLIYTPAVGFHNDVYGLDFSSLYPSIMKKENISVDTINCDCCRSDGRKVPGLDYHFCIKRTGLIPSVIGNLIERRRKYKRMPEEFASLRRNALKWVLVTSFGYTGYRNAKFGSIECHESINAFGRELLLLAARKAEAMGFTVLHGIVDSLWIKGSGDAAKYARDISSETGIPFDIEGRYRWIVFLNNKGNGEGSLNKYYGLFDDGTYKLRGIEIRRSDTPEVVRFAQNIMLEHLRSSTDREDFMQRAAAGLSRIVELVRDIRRGSYPVEDMIITKRVSKKLDEYRSANEQRSALLRLKEAGIDVNAGDVVRYIISASRKERNVVPEQVLTESDEYEPKYYLRLIARALSTMLLPFGYTEKKILSVFRYS